MASKAIEDAVLDVFDLGDEGVRNFMMTCLVGTGENSRPPTQFSARLPKVNSPTFSNVYDVEKSQENVTEKQIVQVDRKIFKRLVTAQLAGRVVNFQEAARYKAFSVPISLFKTDKTMRGGNKSALVNPMLKSAGVDKLDSIPPKPSNDTHYCVDVMYLVRCMPLTAEIKVFGDFSNAFCKVVFEMPGDQIDAACDRYEKSSPKEGTRKGRAKTLNKKSTKKKIKKSAVEKVLTPEIQFPANERDFSLFLSLNKNKESLQMLLGKALIDNAPPNKTIVVSGAFEDPTEVRSNKLSPREIKELECDHEEADTRLVLHVLKAKTDRSVVWCNDTDVVIALLSNYSKIKHKEVFMRRGKADYLDVIALAKGLIARCHIKVESLSILHAISGSDQSSYIHGIGKITAWNTYLEHHVSNLTLKDTAS